MSIRPFLIAQALGVLLALPCVGTLASSQEVGSDLETVLDAHLAHDPLPLRKKYDATIQGLAEAIELHAALLKSGAMSPRGWVLDCRGLRRQARAWLEQTTTLSGVFHGASLLEHWSTSCRPRMNTLWTKSDLRRIEQATVRAAQAFPSSWPDFAQAYTPRRVRGYLQQVNRHWTLTVAHRPCARQALQFAQQEGWSFPRAAFESTDCSLERPHGVLFDHDLAEQLEGVPMATVLATPFLGLDRWVIDPPTLASAILASGSMEGLTLEMLSVVPSPQVIVNRKQWLATVVQGEAFGEQAQREVKALVATLPPVLTHWPESGQCQKAGDQVRHSLHHATHVPVILEALVWWPRLQVVCPAAHLGDLDPKAINEALAKAARLLPKSAARQALGAPLAQDYFAQVDALLPPKRLACLKEKIDEVRQASDIQPMGLRRARAYCPTAHQPWQPAQEAP